MAMKGSHYKKNAYKAGQLDAETGEDRYDQYQRRDRVYGEAYLQGKADRMREMSEEFERCNHPMRTINRHADALSSSAEDSDVADLARMIVEITDYILEKEEGL